MRLQQTDRTAIDWNGWCICYEMIKLLFNNENRRKTRQIFVCNLSKSSFSMDVIDINELLCILGRKDKKTIGK